MASPATVVPAVSRRWGPHVREKALEQRLALFGGAAGAALGRRSDARCTVGLKETKNVNDIACGDIKDERERLTTISMRLPLGGMITYVSPLRGAGSTTSLDEGLYVLYAALYPCGGTGA